MVKTELFFIVALLKKKKDICFGCELALNKSNVGQYWLTETQCFAPKPLAGGLLELTSKKLVIDLLKHPCWLAEMR